MQVTWVMADMTHATLTVHARLLGHRVCWGQLKGLVLRVLFI